MGFFDDDSFEDVVNQLFGSGMGSNNQRRNNIIESEEDERMIDFVDLEKEAYLIFELPGYKKEDVKVVVSKEEIEVIAKRKVSESIPDYLASKLKSGIQLKKILPKDIRKKNYDTNFNNGILEVKFRK
jgi:HSP20 family molecular chaperone IbpA